MKDLDKNDARCGSGFIRFRIEEKKRDAAAAIVYDRYGIDLNTYFLLIINQIAHSGTLPEFPEGKGSLLG